jgi:hypothetical protein
MEFPRSRVGLPWRGVFRTCKAWALRAQRNNSDVGPCLVTRRVSEASKATLLTQHAFHYCAPNNKGNPTRQRGKQSNLSHSMDPDAQRQTKPT